jgi:hypothetical protein
LEKILKKYYLIGKAPQGIQLARPGPSDGGHRIIHRIGNAPSRYFKKNSHRYFAGEGKREPTRGGAARFGRWFLVHFFHGIF